MTSATLSGFAASASMDIVAASVLSSVAGTIRSARAVLAIGDPAGATRPATVLLAHAEAVVYEWSCVSGQDPGSWSMISALRDEIGGYLWAAGVLEESGVAPALTVALLRRGTDRAQEQVERLVNHG